MKIEIEYPSELSATELDRRLAQGWFRSGPVIFRAPVLHVDEHLRQLVHLRVRLDLDDPSRTRRRLLRRNRERFRCTVGKAQVDDARRDLYLQTRKRFIGLVPRDLEVLALGELPGVFDTREVCVYDGDGLVAVSYFDVGRRAVAGILGLHDPRFARHSLGIYTMLEEMAFARQLGARWYYPGYVIPDLPGFDYKLRLGPTQYRNDEGRWRTRVHPPSGTPDADHATARMRSMKTALGVRGVPADPRVYPAFWLGHTQLTDKPCLAGMWHLRCSPPDEPGHLVVEHLPDSDVFIAAWVHAMPLVDAFEAVEDDPEMEERCERRVLLYKKLLLRSDDVEQIADVVAEALDKG